MQFNSQLGQIVLMSRGILCQTISMKEMIRFTNAHTNTEEWCQFVNYASKDFTKIVTKSIKRIVSSFYQKNEKHYSEIVDIPNYISRFEFSEEIQKRLVPYNTISTHQIIRLLQRVPFLVAYVTPQDITPIIAKIATHNFMIYEITQISQSILVDCHNFCEKQLSSIYPKLLAELID